MLKEFKKFIMRGNVMDMAVGVIIGGAFGKIVTSLVNDILMPLIGLATAGVNFSELAVQLNEETSLAYGAFIQAIIDFLIVAFCIFLMVKAVNKASELAKKKEEEAPAPEAPKGPTQEELLVEIRDLLKKN